MLSGTVILSHIGGHGHADAFHRQRKHLADLLSRGLRRHRSGAQEIDGILHDHRADGGN